jgi:hypothetical protein
MAINLSQKLALATASTTLCLTVSTSLPTTAAIVTYDFNFFPYNQPTITGSFSYDTSSVIDYPAQYVWLGHDPSEFGLPSCYLFNSSDPNLPNYCISSGSSVRQFIDFQLNFSGTTFTKNNAETFDLTWERDFPETHGLSFYGPFTGFSGTATWNNPFLSLAFFNPPGPFGLLGNFSTDITNPATTSNFVNTFDMSESSFTLRVVEPTSVPEGRQEPALLALGVLSIASFLKKKISSSQPN